MIIGVLMLSSLGLAAQTTATSAQQRTVTKAEIEKVEGKAEARLKKLSFRVKTTLQSYRDDPAIGLSTDIMTTEYMLPNRTRVVYENEGQSGSSRTETIRIGNKVYSKTNKGPWKIVKKMSAERLGWTDSNYGSSVSISNDYRYLGKQDLNAVLADLYEIVTTHLIRSLGRDIVEVVSEKTYFAKKGRILKKEIKRSDNIHNSFDKEITEYWYDRPIKIKAPIK